MLTIAHSIGKTFDVHCLVWQAERIECPDNRPSCDGEGFWFDFHVADSRIAQDRGRGETRVDGDLRMGFNWPKGWRVKKEEKRLMRESGRFFGRHCHVRC